VKLKNEARYVQAIERSVGWVIKQQVADGSFGPEIQALQAYYNAPNLLTVTGRYREAGRLADCVQRSFLKPDGDFRADPDSRSPGQKAYRHIYMNGWLVSGFQRMGRFDLSTAGLKYISSFQDEATGGIWSAANADYKPNKALLELSGASTGGLAMLYCEQIERARRAADFICMLVETQPDFDRYLYTVYKPNVGLVTEPPADMLDACVVDAQKEWAWYWQLGFAMHTLGKTYLATGENKYLAIARKLFDFFERCQEDRFRALASGKVAWGAAILYKVTGDDRYLEVIEQILDNFVEMQQPEGTWFNFPYFKSLAEQPPVATLELTIELAYLSSEVVSTLAGN